MKASPKAVPAFVNWTPAREKRPGPAVRAPRFVGEAAPGVFGVLGVWALGLGEKGVCWVALFCGVVDIVFKAANRYTAVGAFPRVDDCPGLYGIDLTSRYAISAAIQVLAGSGEVKMLAAAKLGLASYRH